MISNSEARKRREHPNTITITISREAAERFARYYDRCDDDCTAGPCEMHKIVSAALEGER